MRYRLLGPVQFRGSDRPDIGGPKQRALLATLLLSAGTVQSPSQIIDALWEGHPPRTARNLVRVYVHQLRKQLGDAGGDLVTESHGYRLRVRTDDLDVTVCEQALSGRRARRWSWARTSGPPVFCGLRWSCGAVRSPAMSPHRRSSGCTPRVWRRCGCGPPRTSRRSICGWAGASPGRAAPAAGLPVPLPGAAAGAVHARPLPFGPAGGGARRVPSGPGAACHGAGGGTGTGGPGRAAADPRRNRDDRGPLLPPAPRRGRRDG